MRFFCAMNRQRRLRIAPTPSGYLHLGNAFNFLLTASIARSLNADLLLRIDDIDSTRARQEYISDIFETLHWLQIPVTSGPSTVTEFDKYWSQLHRMELYKSWFNQLQQRNLIFVCSCTRTQLKAVPGNNGCVQNCYRKDTPIGTPETSVKVFMPLSEQVIVKDEWNGLIDVAIGVDPGCFTVWRKENLPAYQLCSIADDMHYNITDIIRGEDLLHSTAAQYWMAKKLDAMHFLDCRFYHHPLLFEPSGAKLSKSEGAYALKEMRAKGATAHEIIERFNEWLNKLPIH